MNPRPFNRLKDGTLSRAWWEDGYDESDTTIGNIACRRAGGLHADRCWGSATTARQASARESCAAARRGTRRPACACSPHCPRAPCRRTGRAAFCSGSARGNAACRTPGAGSNATFHPATARCPTGPIVGCRQSQCAAASVPARARIAAVERAADRSGASEPAGTAERAGTAATPAQYASTAARRANFAPARGSRIAPPSCFAAGATT